MTQIREILYDTAVNYDVKAKDKETTYHNTAMLLKLYRKVLWRLENAVQELEMEYNDQTNSNLLDFVDALVDIDPRIEEKRMNSRLRSIEESKSIIQFIDLALHRLKEYPDYGESYYDILYLTYIQKDKMSILDIMDSLHISRTTFYREKKKAIQLLGIILWGFILPQIAEKN